MGKKQTRYAAKQAQALSLRLAGASFRQIAEVLDDNPGNIWRMVKKGLPEREATDEELQLDLARLDAASWPSGQR